MPSNRTPLEAAAGKLIAAIQKEWHAEAGEPKAAASEEVMHQSHLLLQSAKREGSITSVIGPGTLAQFLGTQWVQVHPNVWPYIQALEALNGQSNA